jgi:1-acyl-sn-glycerol-3-phosphate acyltransferase
VGALGVPADVVVVAGPGAVLKTPSGKIRRGATREAWRRGELGQPRAAVTRQWSRLLAAAVAGWMRRGLGLAADGLRAAYLAAFMAATLPVLWAAVRLAPGARAADRAVGTWCRLALACGGCRLEVEGGARLEAAGAVVLVGNHASYLDVVALLAALPGGIRFVAKRELARWPVVGAVIARCGHLTVERDDPWRSVADARRAAEALAAGTSLFVFPEGTFVRSPGILPFRLGAFKAAVDTGRPIVPVGIRGTRDILPAGAWLPRRGAVTITVGEPLPPAGTGWPEMVRLRDSARAAVAAAAGEPPRD